MRRLTAILLLLFLVVGAAEGGGVWQSFGENGEDCDCEGENR